MIDMSGISLQFPPPHWSEVMGAVFGLAGSLVLALRSSWSGLGFVLFLVSNVGWIVFALHHSHGLHFVQQLGFTLASLLGIWQWLVRPWLHSRSDQKEARHG